MPIMNASELKDARTNKWAPDYGGGVGFETYQFVLGAAAFAAVALVFWLVGQLFIGLGIGLAAAYMAAILPNQLNTHNQDPRKYLEGLVRKKVQRTLILNDQRVADPPDERERYVLEVTEFDLTRSMNHDR